MITETNVIGDVPKGRVRKVPQRRISLGITRIIGAKRNATVDVIGGSRMDKPETDKFACWIKVLGDFRSFVDNLALRSEESLGKTVFLKLVVT